MTQAKTLVYNEEDESLVKFDRQKLHTSLQALMFGLNSEYVNLDSIVKKVESGIPERISTYELREFVGECIANNVIYHPDHSILAGRLIARGLQKSVGKSFSRSVRKLFNHKILHNPETGVVSRELHDVVLENSSRLDSVIDHKRDLSLSYFGLKTLQKSYLLKIKNRYMETPQFMFLRVAIGIHGKNIDSVLETYELMSQKYFIHASPTLFNAGTDYNFLSSCFLVATEDDSIDGIYKTLHKTALISKASGGVGLHVHNIRGEGSLISSSGGTSSGLVPMLRVFNNTARYVDQGGNKRPGAFAIYVEPWHSDVFDFLDLRKNHGNEERRARDLFYGLWIPDLFMERVQENKEWSLFSSDTAPGLSDCYGDEFKGLYEKYESEGLARRKVSAQRLWHAILESQIETGGPYMLYKDACNSKSNQKNLGTIKSSNLCCEVVEYTSKEETAVCNLGSLALPTYIKSGETTLEVDLDKLHYVTKVLTRNLNKIIDVTKYPVSTAEYSNLKNRPIAIGVQGLADLFMELRLPFDSEAAKVLNIQIFETIYHAAIETSIELAKRYGPYDSFKDSPVSQGILQFDMWNHKPSDLFTDWDQLKLNAKKYGVRNSLLVAPMPTASTSQILGFNECFEPFTSNVYNRRVLSGEFQVVNRYLLRDLVDLGLWNSPMKNRIIADNGSIQNIPGIPKELKDLYKTVWEISQKVVIDMACDRAKFIDQLQSMNVHLKAPTLGKLTSCHFYAWKKGLKTGMYYLRTQAAARAIQFTVDMDDADKVNGLAVASNVTLNRKRYIEVGKIKNNGDEAENGARSLGKPPLKKFKSEGLSKVNLDIHFTKSDGIYDTRPFECGINELEACDSCSG